MVLIDGNHLALYVSGAGAGGTRDGQIMSEWGGAQTLHQPLHRPTAAATATARDRIHRGGGGGGGGCNVTAIMAAEGWVAISKGGLRL